jgi:L-alanine-DL-glutamate epimerase-like enolase superfamily enzyme
MTINVELLDYFSETQKREFHLLKIKAETGLKGYGDVFTFKLVEGGEEVTEM